MEHLPESFVYVYPKEKRKGKQVDEFYMQRFLDNGNIFYTQGAAIYSKKECLDNLNNGEWIMKRWIGEEL